MEPTQSFKATRREGRKVLPSGVEFVMRSLIGDHQAWITDSDDKKRKENMDKMLLDCLVSIGTKKNLTAGDVDRLIGFDRAFIFFELRMFSNRRNKDFCFDYEFAADADGNRRKQRYNIVFDKKDFPQRPAFWVLEKMKSDLAGKLEKKESEITKDEVDTMLYEATEFPVMYNTYDEMLTERKSQTVTLPDSKVEVTWEMVDGAQEKKFAANMKKPNSHTPLLQRSPKYKDETFKEGNVLPSLPIGQLSFDDIETLRQDYMTKEADIDTSVVIMYKNDNNCQTQVNLITIASFFFPSLAV